MPGTASETQTVLCGRALPMRKRGAQADWPDSRQPFFQQEEIAEHAPEKENGTAVFPGFDPRVDSFRIALRGNGSSGTAAHPPFRRDRWFFGRDVLSRVLISEFRLDRSHPVAFSR